MPVASQCSGLIFEWRIVYIYYCSYSSKRRTRTIYTDMDDTLAIGNGCIGEINESKTQPRFGKNSRIITSQEYEVPMTAVRKEKDGSEVHQ